MSTPVPPIVPEIDVHEAARQIGSGEAYMIDVREADEWALGRAPQAGHLPLSALEPSQVPTDRPVIAMCRSGNRSGKAAAQLGAAGLYVTNIVGGMKAWDAAGLPVVVDGGAPGVVK